MIKLFSFFFVVIIQANTVYSSCPFTELCHNGTTSDEVVCDGSNGNQSEDMHFPSLSCLLPVQNYSFSNFDRIQANAFENMTFLTDHSITIYLSNITAIDSDAFCDTMMIPENSTISLYIENSADISSITLQVNAFNHLKIDRLSFSNINYFNGNSMFNTNCFGSDLYINELIFEQSGLTGFFYSEPQRADIEHLYIRDCPALTGLTNNNLPSRFLSATKTLEISDTGLQYIDPRTFVTWTLLLRELRIRNNPNLQIFPSDIVDGVLMELTILDLSNNSITVLDQNYDWFPFSYTKHLILKQQQQLDLFLTSNILKTLGRLRTIDFSEGVILNNDEDLVRNYVPSMPNVAAINISYTNFTENMVIDLLTGLSISANQTIVVSLLGHTLNDTNFCSYFKVFQESPNLLRLELDEKHDCTCVVDLFFDDEHIQLIMNDSLIQPSCLSNLTRAHCDIQSQLIISKCSVGRSNSDDSGTNGGIGTYAFAGIMVGLGFVLLVLLALGSSVVYRARLGRRATMLDMEDPVENPSSATIDEPIENSSSVTINEPIENPSSATIDEPIENPSLDTMEETLQTSF